VRRAPAGLTESHAVVGLDVELGSATVLVGDNGSGSSTPVEALAVAAGFDGEAMHVVEDDAAAVRLWRRFLDDPGHLLRVLDDDG
jgi:ABC-type branched-subunit amino acid transport system ATPase component